MLIAKHPMQLLHELSLQAIKVGLLSLITNTRSINKCLFIINSQEYINIDHNTKGVIKNVIIYSTYANN